MNIKIEKANERHLREMLSKNSRYGSIESIVNEAVALFYAQEKKHHFR